MAQALVPHSTRGDLVSFAAIDSTGRLHSAGGKIPYPWASLGKAMVLAAYLRRLETEGAPLTSVARQQLTAMITGATIEPPTRSTP